MNNALKQGVQFLIWKMVLVSSRGARRLAKLVATLGALVAVATACAAGTPPPSSEASTAALEAALQALALLDQAAADRARGACDPYTQAVLQAKRLAPIAGAWTAQCGEAEECTEARKVLTQVELILQHLPRCQHATKPEGG